MGVEAGGMGVFEAGSIGKHASRIHSGLARKGIMQGFKSLFLLDENGMSLPSSTIAVGLNYPGIGPIHAYLYEIGRLEITSVTNVQAIEAFQEIAQKEGLLIALESAHAISAGIARAKELTKDKVVLINVSGRGDNYIFNLAKSLKDKEFESFCNEFKL